MTTQNGASVSGGTAVLESEENNDVLLPEIAPAVTWKVRRGVLPDSLIHSIVEANADAVLTADEETFTISAPFINVNRQKLEYITGKLSDISWRMLFINRDGEVKEFTNSEFSIGLPNVVVEEEPAVSEVEMTQFNVRIPKELKEEMDKFRSLTEATQHSYVTEALKMLNDKFRHQII